MNVLKLLEFPFLYDTQMSFSVLANPAYFVNLFNTILRYSLDLNLFIFFKINKKLLGCSKTFDQSHIKIHNIPPQDKHRS